MGGGYPPQTAGLVGQIDHLGQQLLRLDVSGVFRAGLTEDHRLSLPQAADLALSQENPVFLHLQIHVLIRMDLEELVHGHG